ncbi:unnamed protein product [Rotaria sordida]|uniref:F-box domain-containing protein n=1 Tax=Rotaria sordida TaxID=392033 RepID=A0A813YUP9_9BILA|nr:unnamed protein product [Rotaria sordida]CAF3941127.1 unnamed protein product [Rotaria sordida]
MEYSSVQLDDLPDEILMIIFKKLNNLEILYSLIVVNKQLNKIVYDSIFTCDLTLLRNVSNNSVYPLPDCVLDRFCLQILPEIHHQIKWLHLESSSLKRILLSTNYPNLFAVGVFDIEKKNALRLFTGKIFLLEILLMINT